MSRPLSSPYSVEMGYSININFAKELLWWRAAVLNQDMDCTIIIDGKEGAGKSLLAQQVAKFLDKDHELTMDQVEFTFDAIRERVRTVGRGKAVIYDEAGRSTDRRGSGSKANREFNQFLRECRAYNVFLVIVMQSFYDMDMVSAVWRSRVLLNVSYSWNKENPEKPLVRGNVRFYNENAKKALYTNDVYRRQYIYPGMNGSFDFHFPGFWVLDHKEYLKKKLAAEQERKEPTKKEKTKHKYTCPSCQRGYMIYSRKDKMSRCNLCPYEIDPLSTGAGNTPIMGVIRGKMPVSE